MNSKNNDDIQAATHDVANTLFTGEADIFIVRKYEGNDGEFVSMRYLLAKDIFSSLIFPVDDNIRNLFPVESIVWLNYVKKKGVLVTEATCDDEIAKINYRIAVAKLRKYKEQEAQKVLSATDGHHRFYYYKKKEN